MTIIFFHAAFVCLSQTLGNYPTASTKVGGNISVSPLSTPSNISKMHVYGSPGFSGLLVGNNSTGKIRITNAKPVGVHTIFVRAFSSSGNSIVRSFSLTVVKPDCSPGDFISNVVVDALGPNLVHLAVGDFDNDGRQDIVTANMGMNTVSVRLGNSVGGFSGNTEVLVTSHPHAIAIGDFNRDGKQDFVVTNQGNAIVAVRLGNGSGGFGSSPNVNVGNGPVSIAVGDFNEDGKPDFATANLNSHNVSIRIGDGSGNFTSNPSVYVGAFPYSVALGDFNNDHHVDIATANGGSNSMSVRFGDGTGHFIDSVEIPAGVSPYCISVGDFNGDGKQDLACANYTSNTVSIRLGNGQGAFSGNTEIPVGLNPYFITTGNFNGDEFLDIATANYLGNTVSIRLGDGMGNFSGTNDIGVGSYPISLGVGDFNLDGLVDIAVSNYHDNTISVLYGNPGAPPPVQATSNDPVCIGDDIQLNQVHVGSGLSIKWVGPNGFSSSLQNPIIPTSTFADSGVYSVTVTNTAGCSASSSTEIHVNSLPNVSLILPIDTLCNDDNLVLLTGGIPSGGFFSGMGVAGNQFNPSTSGPGIYTITYTYTDTNGCTNSGSDRIDVLLCTAVGELNIHNTQRVYPNPFGNELILELSSDVPNLHAGLFSMDGKLIMQWKSVTEGKNVLPVDFIEDGIYLFRILNSDSNTSIGLVKITR